MYQGSNKSALLSQKLISDALLRLLENTPFIDLDTIPNLYCVGRNGQHRYNNIDHSMVTSFEAVKAIKSGTTDKSALWNVNTEKEYHEEKK